MSEPRASGWRRVSTADGSLTLAHPVHGEACHSNSGARLESRARYVLGCRLPERWRAPRARPWRILDVGTGVGWNLAATLEERARLPAARRPRLELVTLEVERAVLEAAFALQTEQPQGTALAAVHHALGALLDAPPGARAEVEPGVELQLCLGDARESVRSLEAAPGFDALYLDPFSPRLEPQLWSLEFLRELARLAAAGARLATYSATTLVRARLVLAGWEVGPAPRVGGKAEGTLAVMGGELEGFEAKVERRVQRRVRELGECDTGR